MKLNQEELLENIKEFQEAEAELSLYEVLLESFGDDEKAIVSLKIKIPKKHFSKLIKMTRLSSFQLLAEMEKAANERVEKAFQNIVAMNYNFEK